jgi:hypothetical protein
VNSISMPLSITTILIFGGKGFPYVCHAIH